MDVVTTIAQVRQERRRYSELGLVPTMGFLHAGHLSLVERAKKDCGAVAVSIFVNPTQFGPNEDLARYPRDLTRDLDRLASVGTDLVFTPEPAEIYPPGFATSIDVGPVAQRLEGTSRPGHFAGVATVVAKLFNIFQPTRAYFGQKDAQQSLVIRRMALDLDLPVDVVVAPTVRERDGLAMSSRNSYLNPEERFAAAVIHRALQEARRRWSEGERSAQALRHGVCSTIGEETRFKIDYVSIADAETLVELEDVNGPALALVAAKIGATRLIDNMRLDGPAD